MNKINYEHIDEIILPPIIGLDSEFPSLDTKNAQISVLSISDYVNKIEYAFDFNSNLYTHEQKLRLIKKIAKCELVLAHNAKVEISIIYSNFDILLTNCFCTMVASQILDNGYGFVIKKDLLKGTEYEGYPDKIYFTENMIGGVRMMPSPHGLHGVIRRFLGISLAETIDKKKLQRSFIGIPKGRIITEEQLLYACSDVEFLYLLYLKMLPWIKEREQQSQIAINNKLTPVLVKMEHRGCLIDQEKHKKNVKNWEKSLYETECKLDNILVELSTIYESIRGGKYTNKRIKEKITQSSLFEGNEITVENENRNNVNYGSSKQLEDIFKRLSLPFPTDDDGKTSFGEEALKMYTTNNPESILRPFIALLLDFREYSKLLSTYGEHLLKLLDKDGRMRTNYTQCFTDTGRLTSSAIISDVLGLNLSNIPKRNDMKSIFIPDEGYSFIDCDLTGQELITVASYSKEPLLIKAFKEKFDHHSFLASISYSIIFGRQVEIKNKTEKEIEVDGYKYKIQKLRDEHKSCLFSVIYLGGPRRIQNILNEYLCNHIEPKNRFSICEKISKALYEAMPSLIKYLKNKVNEVKKNRFVKTTKMGGRRYFDFPEKAYGDAANFDVQASGAMQIKIALINIDRWFQDKAHELGIKEEELGWICFSIYDQNLMCLNDKYLEYAPELQQIMANALTYFLDGITGSSDLQIKKFWYK